MGALLGFQGEPESAKKLEETIAALEKTYLGGKGESTGPEDAIGRLGRGFETFKANHYK